MANHDSGKRAAGHKPAGKRALSLLLALVMSLSLVQITAFAVNGETAETAAKQVTTPGGTAYYKADGTECFESDWAVKLSRTLTETGTENLFNVDLEVTTKDNTVSADAEAAAVLVIDTSGSMGFCTVCGEEGGKEGQNHGATGYQWVYECDSKPGSYWADEDDDDVCDHCGKEAYEWDWFWGWVSTHTEKRIPVGAHPFQSRLTAAKKAAKDFLDDYAKNASGSTSTKPRYVAIVAFADKAITKCAWVDVTKGTTEVEAAINALGADGGTNTEAGLQLAANLLGQKKDDVENRFAVLLTDGLPTFYIEDHEDNSHDGLDVVPSGYTTTEYFIGIPYKKEHSGVAGPGDKTTTAETAPVENVSKALKKTAGVHVYGVVYGLTKEDGTMETVPNSKGDAVAIDTWMKNDCQMEGVFKANSTDALNTAFKAIINTIRQETVGTTTVTAVNNEAGEGALTNLYSFVQFINQNGATVANNEVAWELSKATPEAGATDSEKTYKLSYQVWMHTEADGFQKDTPYSLGAASLSFKVGEGDPKTVAFPEVAAKGYLGELNFDKVNEKGQALSGATFQLASAAKTMTAESAANVAFSSIPSGYTYTLSEASAPNGYVKTDKTWTVTVAYGDVTVAGVEDLGNFKVENEKIPVEEPASYTVKYYVEDATGKFNQYGEDKVYEIAEDQTEATLEDLYDAFANVASGYQFNKDYTDIYNDDRTAGSVAPGATVEVKDKDVINLYYELAPVQMLGYTVEYYLKDSDVDKYEMKYSETFKAELGEVTIAALKAAWTNVPEGVNLDEYVLDADMLAEGYDGVAPGANTFSNDGQVFKLYYKKAPIPMPEYTVEYYLKDSDTDKYEVKYSKTVQAEYGEVTIAALKAAWTDVPEDVNLDEYVLDADMLAEGYDGVAPGTHTFSEVGQVFKLYYKKAPAEPEGPFTYWVKHIYMNGMLVDGVKDEYFENVEAGTKVVPAELHTYPDYTVNGVKHVYQVEKLDPDVETLITKNDQVFYIYYQRNDPTPEYITVTVNYVEKDNTSNVLRTPQSKTFALENGVASYTVTDLKIDSLTVGGTTYSYDSASALLEGKAESDVTITLYYKVKSSEPIVPPVGPTVTYYTVTVNYYDKASGESIHTPYTDSKPSGSSYDVTAQDKIAITGYTYVETTGDALTGTLNGSKAINVYYSKDAEQPSTPTEPGEKPSAPTEPVQPPKTGDSMGLWIAAAMVSGMGLIWLSLSGKKRKEEV